MSLPAARRWFERRRVDPAITMLWEPHVHPLLQCNMWYVEGRGTGVLIDTGLGVADLTVAATDLFDADVLAVATHAHMDHAGGLAPFRRRAIHRDEVEVLADAGHHLPLDVGAWDQDTLDWLAAADLDISAGLLTAVPNDRFALAEHRMEEIAATRVLDEGDVIDLGDRAFEVLHLPGHSPGSIGLYDAGAKVLFSGDALYDGVLLDDLPESDLDAYLDTMARLRSLDVDVVHGGHGPSMDRPRFIDLIDAYLATRPS